MTPTEYSHDMIFDNDNNIKMTMFNWKLKSTKEILVTGTTVDQLHANHMGLRQVILITMMMVSMVIDDVCVFFQTKMFNQKINWDDLRFSKLWSGQSIDERGEQSIEMQ